MTETIIQKWKQIIWYSLWIVRHIWSDPLSKYRTGQTKIGNRRSLDHGLSFERCRIRFSSTYIITKCEFVADLYEHDPPSDTKCDRAINLRSMYFGKNRLVDKSSLLPIISISSRRTNVRLSSAWHPISSSFSWLDNATSIKTPVFPRWTWNVTHPQRSKCLRV